MRGLPRQASLADRSRGLEPTLAPPVVAHYMTNRRLCRRLLYLKPACFDQVGSAHASASIKRDQADAGLVVTRSATAESEAVICAR